MKQSICTRDYTRLHINLPTIKQVADGWAFEQPCLSSQKGGLSFPWKLLIHVNNMLTGIILHVHTPYYLKIHTVCTVFKGRPDDRCDIIGKHSQCQYYGIILSVEIMIVSLSFLLINIMIWMRIVLNWVVYWEPQGKTAWRCDRIAPNGVQAFHESVWLDRWKLEVLLNQWSMSFQMWKLTWKSFFSQVVSTIRFRAMPPSCWESLEVMWSRAVDAVRFFQANSLSTCAFISQFTNGTSEFLRNLTSLFTL